MYQIASAAKVPSTAEEKEKKTQKDEEELTSVCPGRIAISDNETPFPLFSSAEEEHERIKL